MSKQNPIKAGIIYNYHDESSTIKQENCTTPLQISKALQKIKDHENHRGNTEPHMTLMFSYKGPIPRSIPDLIKFLTKIPSL